MEYVVGTVVLKYMKFNNINVNIGQNVKLGKNVRIGDNTTIYDNVEIGDNTIISSNCLIGEPVGDYYFNDEYSNPKLVIGANCVVRSNTIIYAGSIIGDKLQTGHHTVIRERNTLGCGCVVGVYCNILPDCKIGDCVHFHSYDSIAENSTIGDYVYFFPFVTITGDPTPPSNNWLSSKVGDFSVIASNVFFLPGTEIGRHCLVAAQARVGGKYEDFSLIAGTPAKRIIDVRKAPIINNETKRRQYPWPYNYDRGMPWESIGFDEWLKINNMEI